MSTIQCHATHNEPIHEQIMFPISRRASISVLRYSLNRPTDILQDNFRLTKLRRCVVLFRPEFQNQYSEADSQMKNLSSCPIFGRKLQIRSHKKVPQCLISLLPKHTTIKQIQANCQLKLGNNAIITRLILRISPLYIMGHLIIRY